VTLDQALRLTAVWALFPREKGEPMRVSELVPIVQQDNGLRYFVEHGLYFPRAEIMRRLRLPADNNRQAAHAWATRWTPRVPSDDPELAQAQRDRLQALECEYLLAELAT
jgi:hypothetical protein